MYRLQLAYHDPVRFVTIATAEDRSALIPLRNAERRAHRDVRAGRANVAIRKVGS